MTSLRIHHDPAAHTVHLTGELDYASAPDLVAALAEAVDGTSDLQLDLRGLGFMDSTGIHVIVNVARTLAGYGTLVLVGPTPPVARVLELTGIIGQIPNVELVADLPLPEQLPPEILST
jgi:anti-sigma B factor antagonist